MLTRGSLGILALAGALAITATTAFAFDDAQYPNIKGTWERPGSAAWDPTKPGTKQEAPLTPEYQAVYEANLQDQKTGGQSYNGQARCLPAGVPRVMIAYDPLEFIITPEITYIRSDHLTENRRIYTDGRTWPDKITPTFWGYSLGKWVDENGDGKYDVLEVETRGFKGPRQLDASGMPLHEDNQTLVHERIYIDKDKPNVLHDTITTTDHALTKPWTITRSYNRVLHPTYSEEACGEANRYLILGKETYYLSGDSLPMPTRKDQPPPDLRFFKQTGQ